MLLYALILDSFKDHRVPLEGNTLSKRSNLVCGEAFKNAYKNMWPKDIGLFPQPGESEEQDESAERLEKSHLVVSEVTVDERMFENGQRLVKTLDLIAGENLNGRPSKDQVDAYIPRLVHSFLVSAKGKATGMVTKVGVLFVSCTSVFGLSDREIKKGTVSKERLLSFSRLFKSIMSVITKNEGDLVNFLYDDKGCTLIALFPTRVPLR